MQPELRSHDNDGTPRVIDPLPKQVLTETPLLTLQHVAQRLERTLVGSTDRATATAIIEKGINRFLQHPHFVSNNHARRLQFDQALQAIVPIDDTAIQIVQIRGRKPSAVQRHERTQFRRQHRDHIHNHPLGHVAGLAEGLEDFQLLGIFLLQRGGGRRLGFRLDLIPLGRDVDLAEQLPDGIGADTDLVRSGAVLRLERAELFFRNQLLLRQIRRSWIDADIALEIKNALQPLQAHVQQGSDPTRYALQEPDVRHRSRELNVAHALPADLGLNDFDAALVADDAAVLHALILAAITLPILDRAENLRAKQSVFFRLKRPVIDGLRLLHFAVRPRPDFFRRRDLDLHRIECNPIARLLEKCIDAFQSSNLP
ncbi:MAG: hypothetical protein JW394_0996 [Nitrospira sp.]|nr:hypothetical protein [Nitrospira sp.]